MKLPEDIMPALQGIVPAVMATVGPDGMPNVSYISQVFYADEERVAISNQFFSKTHRNLKENPSARVKVMDPESYTTWELDLTYLHSETDGPLFEQMEMQLEAIASMSGMSDVFRLLGADVFHVNHLRPCTEMRVR